MWSRSPSLQQYTYIQPCEIRAKVEELFNCEDIFINAMIADLTMQPGVTMRLSPNSPTPQCLRWECHNGMWNKVATVTQSFRFRPKPFQLTTTISIVSLFHARTHYSYLCFQTRMYTRPRNFWRCEPLQQEGNLHQLNWAFLWLPGKQKNKYSFTFLPAAAVLHRRSYRACFFLPNFLMCKCERRPKWAT